MTTTKSTKATNATRDVGTRKALYSSKIIKAGALLPDTRLLLAHWDLSADMPTNLQRIQQANLLGKASRLRVADILAIFRQRYLGDRQVLAALVVLAQADVPASVLIPILYFLTLQADPLLHDVVLQMLSPCLGAASARCASPRWRAGSASRCARGGRRARGPSRRRCVSRRVSLRRYATSACYRAR